MAAAAAAVVVGCVIKMSCHGMKCPLLSSPVVYICFSGWKSFHCQGGYNFQLICSSAPGHIPLFHGGSDCTQTSSVWFCHAVKKSALTQNYHLLCPIIHHQKIQRLRFLLLSCLKCLLNNVSIATAIMAYAQDEDIIAASRGARLLPHHDSTELNVIFHFASDLSLL